MLTRRPRLLSIGFLLLACVMVSGCTNSESSSSQGTPASEMQDGRWAEEDGFNPDEEDYSNEADDLDCSEVDGPVEIDPEDDTNNLDRDGDGLACEWS